MLTSHFWSWLLRLVSIPVDFFGVMPAKASVATDNYKKFNRLPAPIIWLLFNRLPESN